MAGELKNLRGLSMVHLNVRSLNDTTHDRLITELSDVNIDCITLSETWLTDKIPDSAIMLPGYNITRLDRTWLNDKGEIKQGGRLLCYIHQTFVFSSSEYAHLNISSNDIEIQCITISKQHVRKLIIFNVYRPPDGNPVIFCDKLNATMGLLGVDATKEMFFMGDMNIDLLEPGAKSRNLKNTILQMGCKQLISQATRLDPITKDSLLDLIITNSDHVTSSGIKVINLSDHEMIFISFFSLDFPMLFQ